MSNITTKIVDGIIVNTIVGKIIFYEIIELFESKIEEWNGKLILWDCSEAQIEEFSSNNMRTFIDKIKSLSKKRGFGKTALVSSDNSNYGALRMYEIMVEKHNLETKYASFRNIDEAKKWLLN